MLMATLPTEELDTCTINYRDGVMVATDECHEEVARFGTDGDLLSAFPGMDERELAHCGRFIKLNALMLMAGNTLFYGFTPV